MRMGIPYDSDEGRAIAGALTAILTGYSYASSAEMAQELGPFRRFAENRDAMLRVIRNHRRPPTTPRRASTTGLSTTVVGIDPAACPLGSAPRGPQRLGHRADDRRGVRLPQRPGHLHRPHRHHRPADGLRHHRRRAGLRPGEVQEARRRRLLQDRQPVDGAGAAAPRLLGDAASSRSSSTWSARMSLARRPPHQLGDPDRQGVHRRRTSRRSSAPCRGVFELRFAFNQWTLGEETMQRLGFTPEEYNEPGFDMLRALGFTDDADPGGQRLHLRSPDHRGCTGPARRASPGVRHRQPQRPARAALHPPHRPHQDDGGGAAVHLGGDLEDDQHAQRGDHGRHRGVVPHVVGAGPQGDGPLPGRLEGITAAVLQQRRDGRPSRTRTACRTPSTARWRWCRARSSTAGMFAPGVSPTQAYKEIHRPRFLLPARRHGYTQEARVGGHKVFLRTGEYERRHPR